MSEPVKFSQRAFLFHRVEYAFLERHLDYMIEDEKYKVSFSVNYDAIPLKKSIQTYTEKWPRHVFLALIPGFIISFLMASSTGSHGPAVQIVMYVCYALVIGMGIAAKIPKFQADVIETPEGKLLIFDRPNRPEIIDEIYRRRTAELRRQHLAIDPFNDPQAEIQKYRQLKEQNLVSEQEYTDAIGKLLAKRDKL